MKGLRRVPSTNQVQHSKSSGGSPFDVGNEAAPASSGFRRFRSKVWVFMEDAGSSKSAKLWSIVILLLIGLSTTTFVVETLPSLHERVDLQCTWDIIETVCISLFTVEYFLKLFSVPSGLLSGYGWRRQLASTWRFVRQWLNIVDLIAILPFYIEVAASPLFATCGSTSVVAGGGANLGFVRVIRLVRVFRLFKLSKYNEGLKLFGNTMTKSMRALGMLLFFMLIFVILLSSLVYYAERGTWKCGQDRGGYCLDHQGSVRDVSEAHAHVLAHLSASVLQSLTDAEGELETATALARAGDFTGCSYTCLNYSDPSTCSGGTCFYVRDDGKKSLFESIPAASWWCVVTMTTTGYGDFVPITTIGRVVGFLTMILGILVMALPITVIGSNFAVEFDLMESSKAEGEESDVPPEPSGVSLESTGAAPVGQDVSNAVAPVLKMVGDAPPRSPRSPSQGPMNGASSRAGMRRRGGAGADMLNAVQELLQAHETRVMAHVAGTVDATMDKYKQQILEDVQRIISGGEVGDTSVTA